MQRFLLFLIFNLHIAFTNNLVGQITPSFVRIDPPSFVNVRSGFTTSIVFKVDVLTTDNVLVKFNKPNEIGINSAKFKSWLGEEDIPLTINPENKNEITLELDAEELALDANTMYQILLDCYTPKPVNLNKKLFSWITPLQKETEIEYDETEKIDELEIYEYQKTAGSAIELTKDSELNFKLSNPSGRSVYLEYWVKSQDITQNLLSIRKSSDEEPFLSFFKNDFGFISFPVFENELVRNDAYLGTDNWNYIGVYLKDDFSGLTGSIYVNSKLIFSVKLENIFDLQNLMFDFKVSDPEGFIEIDRMKIWNFDNNIILADRNKHFLSYEADSSSLIYQSTFDNIEEHLSDFQTQNLACYPKNISYVQSDAPLFSKSPKLTVNIGSSYNSIVWYVQEYSVAKEFEIERAVSNNEFQTVYTTLADDDPLKIYYYTDEIVDRTDVAFYRVKQINKDGSIVYSPEIKIGNREIQEFKLSQNYPNPFNPITSIYVEVIIPSEFEINVYDLVGNNVSALYDGYLSEGLHTFEFDGSHLPSGIYFYEVISPNGQSVKKMILAK